MIRGAYAAGRKSDSPGYDTVLREKSCVPFPFTSMA